VRGPNAISLSEPSVGRPAAVFVRARTGDRFPPCERRRQAAGTATAADSSAAPAAGCRNHPDSRGSGKKANGAAFFPPPLVRSGIELRRGSPKRRRRDGGRAADRRLAKQGVFPTGT